MADQVEKSPEVMSRRSFFATLTKLSGGFIAVLLGIPIVGNIISPFFQKPETDWIDLGNADDLHGMAPLKIPYSVDVQDGWYKTKADRFVYVVWRNDDFLVLSPTCSHLGCSVRWDGRKFACPCHGGTYDREGKVTGGPPPKPLAHFATKIESGRLMAKEVV